MGNAHFNAFPAFFPRTNGTEGTEGTKGAKGEQNAWRFSITGFLWLAERTEIKALGRRELLSVADERMGLAVSRYQDFGRRCREGSGLGRSILDDLDPGQVDHGAGREWKPCPQ
jgi:hypothetical protein